MTYTDKLRGIYDLVKPIVRVEGQVVDERGQPLDGAEVVLYWEKATYLLGKRDYELKETMRTDQNGRWSKALEKPLRALVDAVQKDGYEYSREANEKTDSLNLADPSASEKMPIISVLRKRGEPTFLLLSKSRHRAEEPLFQINDGKSASAPVNILEWLGKNSVKVPYVDLQADASFNSAAGRWCLTFCATNGTDGVVSGNWLLYEAPSTGYAPQVSMTLEAREGKAYLYLRSRRPAVYSRIALTYWHEDAPTGRERIRVSYNVCVNPYGERNLEYDDRAESVRGLADGLENEAKAAILSGKYPPKPDISKRVKETSEQLQKERECRARFYNSPEFKKQRDENDRKNKEMLEKRKRQQEAETAGEK